MIPKIIHYCWFGRGAMPELAIKCIDSWKKTLPDYELKLWNEDNFDISQYQYAKEAYEARKFAFVTDIVRLYALYTEGGIYMDTDVEIIKPLDSFLDLTAFSGFESNGYIPTGLMASEKNGKWVSDLLSDYDNKSFILKDGKLDMATNTVLITRYMKNHNFIFDNSEQHIKGLVSIFPSEYFCPLSPSANTLNITPNTICIHHFANSWENKRNQRLSKLKKKLMKYLNPQFVNKVINILNLRALKK